MQSPRKVIPLFGDLAAVPHHPSAESTQPPHDRIRKLKAALRPGDDLSPAEKLHALIDCLTEENQGVLLILAAGWASKFEACDRGRRAPSSRRPQNSGG